MTGKTVLIMDTHNLIWRAHYVHKHLRDRTGRPTGVLFGVLGGLLKMIRHYPKVQIVWAWDGPTDVMTVPSVRRKAAAKEMIRHTPKQPHASNQERWKGRGWRFLKAPQMYKAQRIEKPRPATDSEKVNQQLRPLHTMLQTAGYMQYRVPGLEADDLIGILCTIYQADSKIDKVVLDSTDKDFYQLCTAKVCIVETQSKMAREVDEDTVYQRFSVLPSQWPHYRALTGDPSDGLRGLENCGPVKAKQLLGAGADPSADYESQPTVVQQKVTADAWRQVQMCYHLSRITSAKDDPRLHARTRRKLAAALAMPKPEGNEQEFTKLLLEYDMKYLVNHRYELMAVSD